MDLRLAWEHLKSLPPDRQEEVTDFIEFLHLKFSSAQDNDRPARAAIGSEPFVGIWRGRADMSDGASWLRSLRQREWGTPDGGGAG